MTRNGLQEHIEALKHKKIASLEVLIAEAVSVAFKEGGQ